MVAFFILQFLIMVKPWQKNRNNELDKNNIDQWWDKEDD